MEKKYFQEVDNKIIPLKHCKKVHKTNSALNIKVGCIIEYLNELREKCLFPNWQSCQQYCHNL